MHQDLTAASPESSDFNSDSDSGSDIEDTGNRRNWDPHAGMKPSCRDGCASDGKVNLEGDLPYGGAIEVNGAMIDMMCKLNDDDSCDVDWLPPKELKKLEQRKKGMISPALKHRS